MSVEALIDRALERIAAKQFEEALDDLDQALRREPRNLRARFARGCAYHDDGQHELAADDFDEVLKLDPANHQAYRRRGMCHDSLDCYPQLIADFSRVLAVDPNDAYAYFVRGYGFWELEQYDKALPDYNRSLELDPTLANAFWRRAQLWEDLKQPDKAKADYDRYGSLPLADANAYHSRAHFWQGRDEYEKSLADFTEAIRLEPDNRRHYGCRSSTLDVLGLDELWEENQRQLDRIDNVDGGTVAEKTQIYPLIEEHLAAAPLEDLHITERNFPARVGADLQRALDTLADARFVVRHFFVPQRHNQPLTNFQDLYLKDRRNPVIAGTPQYAEMDIGEDEPVRCLKTGLWLLELNGVKLLAILDTLRSYETIHFSVAARNSAEETQASQAFFRHVEDTVKKGTCYRGKVLSLEHKEMYSGHALGIMVHKLRKVERDQVILPAPTIELLERNVVQFVKQRPRLAALGLPTKKGLLFYGPPGTGKTHTIHYLSAAMQGHTSFLIAAEQVGLMSDYLTLARLFQPSIVVIEDVDLIARDRAEMRSAGEEALLNKLLNEMDGLRADAEVMFILTTNRPEALEAALASRPGRIDQAIEFPLPDAEGRQKLVGLYAAKVPLAEDVIPMTVKKTENVSGSFIKELMRRSLQFALERNGDATMIQLEDVHNALEEMLFRGGALNRKLLGAGGAMGYGFSTE